LAWLVPFAGGAAEYSALPAVLPLSIVPYCCLQTPFGQIVPNVHDWRTGDIVAMRSPSGLTSAPIVGYQTIVFGLSEARHWTHVGIYDGNGHVWDAVPRHNVRHRSVAQLAQEGRTISIRRLVAGPTIDSGRLSAYLSFQLNQRFAISTTHVMRLLIQRALRTSGIAPLAPISADIVFCSLLCLRALQYATNGLTFSEIIPLPGDFMAKREFQEVDAYWCRRQHLQVP
jgi:hypothetical protein